MNQPKEHIAIIQEIMLAKSLMDWREKPNMSLRRIVRNNCTEYFTHEQHIDSSEILHMAIASSLSNLLRQIFVSNYEHLRHNIDDKMSPKLKKLKSDTSANPNSLNTAKFMDAIRQSLVHNDITAAVPNWHLNDEFRVEINFKGNTFTFNFLQLQQIINEFLALKKEHFYIRFDIQERDLVSAVNKGKLTPKSIKQYFLAYNKDETRTTLDQHQCMALYNLLTPATDISPKEHLDIIMDDEYFILKKLFPFKHNAGHISYINNMVFRCLFWINNNYLNREDFIDLAYKFESTASLTDEEGTNDSRCALLEFINYDTIILENTLISNALFTLFSISKSSDLEKYFNGIEVNRLRNSLMHGRYFHNNRNEFEFYDGRDNNNLEHIASLHTDDILTALSNFISDTLTDESSHSI